MELGRGFESVKSLPFYSILRSNKINKATTDHYKCFEEICCWFVTQSITKPI